MRASVFFVCVSVLLGGCSMCSSEEEAAVTEGPRAAAPPLEASEQRVLGSQLRHVREDQRRRSTRIADIARNPRLASSPRTAPLVQDLRRRQVKLALAAQRTDRYVTASDPKSLAYERELARLIAEQHRVLRVLHAAAAAEHLAAELALIEEEEAAWIRSIVAYEVFDDTFDYSIRGSAPAYFVAFDVEQDLARVPRHELYFTFAAYFEATEYPLYAETCGIEMLSAEEWADYAEHDSFDAIDVDDVEYAELALDQLDVDALEQQYDLETPAYYDDLVSDEPDFDPEVMHDGFEGQDEQIDRIYDSEPDALAHNPEYGEYFEADEPPSEEPMAEEPAMEEEPIEEPMEQGGYEEAAYEEAE